MADYTLGLALFDFLPVLAAALGLYFLCRYCMILGGIRQPWLLLVGLIIVAGGLLKASWKTRVVLTGDNLAWMSDQLFFLLASGYLLMTATVVICFRAAAKNRPASARQWVAPVIIAILAVAGALLLKAQFVERYWAFLLLAILAASNLILSLTLITHAVRRRRWVAVAGFAVNLVLVYVLVGLARIQEQTLSLQWSEEILNLISNSAFALASWILLSQRAAEENRRIPPATLESHS